MAAAHVPFRVSNKSSARDLDKFNTWCVVGVYDESLDVALLPLEEAFRHDNQVVLQD